MGKKLSLGLIPRRRHWAEFGFVLVGLFLGVVILSSLHPLEEHLSSGDTSFEFLKEVGVILLLAQLVLGCAKVFLQGDVY